MQNNVFISRKPCSWKGILKLDRRLESTSDFTTAIRERLKFATQAFDCQILQEHQT